MKTTTVLVGRQGSYLKIKAYMVHPGLLIHRSVSNYDGKGAEQTKDNYWTVTHHQGMMIRAFNRFPSQLQDVVAWVEANLTHLEWDIDESELEQNSAKSVEVARTYGEAVHARFDPYAKKFEANPSLL